jgi:putative NADH-flavin reductase
MILTTLRRIAAAGVIAALVAACTLQPTPPAIVVIGATANSSKEIMLQALAAGYDVTGVARRPEDVEVKDPRLKIVKGDVYDPASLAAAMTGREVVVSMVGPRIDPMNLQEIPDSFDLFTTGTRNIIAAMKQKGNRRLLVASSLGVEDTYPTVKPADPKDMRSNWLWKMRNVYQNMEDMEAIVRASGLDYVIFRPAFLVPEPRRDDLKFAVDRDSPKGTMLTFADFGAFVLAQVSKDQYLGHAVGIYTDRPLKFGENVDFMKLAKEAAEKARRANAASEQK